MNTDWPILGYHGDGTHAIHTSDEAPPTGPLCPECSTPITSWVEIQRDGDFDEVEQSLGFRPCGHEVHGAIAHLARIQLIEALVLDCGPYTLHAQTRGTDMELIYSRLTDALRQVRTGATEESLVPSHITTASGNTLFTADDLAELCAASPPPPERVSTTQQVIHPTGAERARRRAAQDHLNAPDPTVRHCLHPDAPTTHHFDQYGMWLRSETTCPDCPQRAAVTGTTWMSPHLIHTTMNPYIWFDLPAG